MNCGFLKVDLYLCVLGGSGTIEASACIHTHSAGLFCFCAVSSPNRAFLKDVRECLDNCGNWESVYYMHCGIL